MHLKGYAYEKWASHARDFQSRTYFVRDRNSADRTPRNRVTIDDPRTYTKPWVSDRKVFIRLEPSELKSGDGWSGLLELACADLAEEFNKRVRDPVGGVR
jgi:hypothetical protein